MWIIVCLKLIAVVIYFFLIRPLKYWEDRKVPYVKPLPIFGNMLPIVRRKLANSEMVQKLYQAFPERRYMGMFNFVSPTLMLRDPDLIKKMLVKDFEALPDHRALVSNDVDPIWNKNLFAMKGDQRWHDMRATLSPTFTSSKMRGMFILMKECAEQFVDYYSKQEEDISIVELKDVFSRFTTDVIATTAFGVTCNSLENPTNEFYMTGKNFTSLQGSSGLRILLSIFLPKLCQIFRIPLFSKKSVDFFRKIIKENIKVREEQHIVRNDMLHLLMEARKGQLEEETETSLPDAGFAVVEESQPKKRTKKRIIEISDEDITAQSLIFFFGGFETVSTLLSYAAYELAVNPDAQKKLQEEVDDVFEKQNGEITYEALMGMKYLDCVVSETLRKWPPAVATNRQVVQKYKIDAVQPEEVNLILEKKSSVVVPIYSIHRDAKHFPNPDKFDPDRFNEENRKNIRPFTYIPFGAGPRSCIANRFALMDGKILLAEMINKFEFVPIEKTPIPIKLDPTSLILTAVGGLWLGLKKRNR